MELVKDIWTEDDKIEFINYLLTLKNDDKVMRSQKILNTNMKVLAINDPTLKLIAKQIRKGNYISFLELNINEYYENVFINGILIASIKEFDVMKYYLDKHVKNVDSWATCDSLKFNINKNEERFFLLAKEYSKSELPFVRRIASIILFRFINRDEYINKIYDMLNRFTYEKDYYVNMANAWLICELFIKRREDTVAFLKNNKLNKFTVNKAVSKCRDSFRVSNEDKEFLLKFKV